ncbi:MAG: spore maturation protein A [Clostridiales bacterium]|nr:spore maturation protein A [Clostridiales bacterium]
MLFSIIITFMAAFSLIYGCLSGNLAAVSAAAADGAREAVNLCTSLCGMICLWSGVIELMARTGLSERLSAALRPVLKKLFPSAAKDRETMDALSTNVSANLLGLGNAATPAGIKAAKGLKRLSGLSSASNELCLLVVMNTASIQLLPTTIASLRASLGASAPFDILPAVWLSSLLSVSAGILSAKIFERFSKP